MDKQQVALIIGTIALILLLFFGFNTKPPKQKLVEKSGAGDEIELQETQNAVRKAKTALTEDVRKYIQGLENVAEASEIDSVRIDALQSLSAAWFDQGAYVPAGYYAEQIAKEINSGETWAIAGSSYGAGLTHEDQELAKLSMNGAVRCFENAISLDPENVDYRINLAICYAEHPPETNPMKGIQSLLELNRNHPENISVLYHLARFGMRTGQYDKAKERLSKALSIDAEQQRLHCLMAELMRETNQMDSVAQYQHICDQVRAETE